MRESFALRLAGFWSLLRFRGLPVGTGAELDLATSLEYVQRLSREEFYLACRTTLVKRPEDLDAFDAAFDEYWAPEVARHAMRAGMERRQSPEPIPHPVGNMRKAWGSPTAGNAAAGPHGMVEDLRILVYSPDAPAGRRQMDFLERRQLEATKRLARGFRRWAATLGGRRFEASLRGEVDFLKTARASLRFGGEWLQVRRRRRKIHRARLTILWDVSGSMEGYGTLLLALIYALLRAAPSTQVFAFSTDLEPVTAALQGRPYSEVLWKVSERLMQARGGTRIGKCLEEFNRRYGGLVDKKTVVMLLSDGWDVGDLDILEEQLRELRRRCHLLVWMNPYADRPDFRPEVAGMRRALPYVDLLVPPSALLKRDVYLRYFRRAISPLTSRRARGLVSRAGAPPYTAGAGSGPSA